MMKEMFGSAIGGLIAGGLVLVAAGPLRDGRSEAPYAPAPAAPAMTVAAPELLSTAVPFAAQAPAPVYIVQPVATAPVAVAQPVATRPTARRPAARPAVYRGDDDIVRYEPDRRQDERSMAKTVLIIGGSAGAGAGVGAIAGGKKGALIGAAIGGGAASIYEATKR